MGGLRRLRRFVRATILGSDTSASRPADPRHNGVPHAAAPRPEPADGTRATAHPQLAEVRGLAPGFVLSFTRVLNLKDYGYSANRIRFPHIEVAGFGDATADVLWLAAELSVPGGRSIAEVIDAVLARMPTDRDRLERFVWDVLGAGYLVAEAPPPRWSEAAVQDGGDAGPVAAGQAFEVPEGSSFLIDGRHFVWFDHQGTLRLRLTVPQMLVVKAFAVPSTAEQAWAASSPDLPRDATPAWFDDLVRRLRTSGLLRPADPVVPDRTSFRPTATNARAIVLEGVRDAVAEFSRAAAARPGSRVAVVPVNDDANMAPLALGLLLAYARDLDGGRLQDRYDFVPLFLADEPMLLEWTGRPAIFLFSNYIWSVQRNLELSALLKRANPANLTIHGGPSTPKYAKDCEDFFAEHPSVDITVRGEGEATLAALLDALDGAAPADLSRLRDVAGLSYRGPEGVVRTPDRPRIEDLDTIPSPYLLGLFEPFGRAHVAAVVESNRGCPYGCTFCDWGSATLQRIRRFDLDRVKAELEWSSRNQLMFVSLCDANFGILERDVEIAEHIAAMKRRHGYPQTAAFNYAKNSMVHLRRIIDTLTGVGLNIEPTIAVQSMDETTLKTVRRSNIKLDRYDELADQFQRAGLRLATDIMMGLPGSTVASFKSDLQKCTDRDVRARCHPTLLLPNSPMNEPSYRAEHGIVARPHEAIKEAKTFSRDDFDEMDRLRVAFYVFDNFGVLRHLARFVRSEVGVQEVDFYDRVSRDAVAQPSRWPIVAAFIRMMQAYLAPPCSWGLFLQEVRGYLVDELDVAPGSALDTALAVQLAHLPASTRTMPQTLDLVHDYAAWHAAALAARSAHRDDWERFAPRLHTFPPGTLEVRDPHDVCHTLVGKPMMVLAWNIVTWDMASPVARAT